MSENRNTPGPGAEDSEPQNVSPDQPAAPVNENAAPTQPLYGQYAAQDASDTQSFAAPGEPDGQANQNQSPYGQAAAGQSPYGQANQNQSPYGQPAAGQSPYSQPPAGQSPYGQNQSPYGQPPAGQSPYGQNQGPYGQPQGYPGYGPGANGYPGSYQAPVQQPGKTMGIIGLILSCLFFIPYASLVGVILSIVAFVQSRKAKISNGPALAGIIVGGVIFVLTLVATIAIFVFAVDQVDTFLEICDERGPGTHFVNGEIYDCSLDEFEQSL